ncbi:MAG TPA: FUSC family protein [Streptosporangiaceae bacterium]|nr:FUSC family protein [Streptosporangiaceae bacterium]
MGWVGELAKQRRAPVPWPEMIRAAFAICLPLSVALPAGRDTLGVLPAMGGLLGILADSGGPYLTRVKRVASASVFGGAVGLAIGSVIHGHGWLAVAGLVVIAGVSALLSSLGDVGSITGLQLLVYTALGIGPVGALRPAWHTALGFLAGVAWALLLTVPGWLLWPRGKEQRNVTAVYQALTAKLSAIGTPGFAGARRNVTGALNTAYDGLLTVRSTSSGRNQRMMRLVAALNSAQLIAEASTALGLAGQRPPPLIVVTMQRLADVVRDGGTPPAIPPAWDSSAAAEALRDAMAGAARVLSSAWTPRDPGMPARKRDPVRTRISGILDGFGWQNRIFAARLMTCVLVAGVFTEVVQLQRSYWVLLTVVVVLKPDYGSVFARALQRGIGTVLGAVLGAVLLVWLHGLWLLVPFAVLAGLLPLGRSRNYGLLAVFLTPLVVILIDLLSPAGWQLALDRLIDTLIGCGIALVVGFLPWWTSWYAHLPRQFAATGAAVAGYLEVALGGSADPAGAGAVPERSKVRRRTYRAVADLRAEFQRTMSEPPSISRRASAWWPAVVGLEQVLDAVVASVVALPAGEVPSAEGVRVLGAALREACAAAAAGDAVLPAGVAWPSDEALAGVTEAVRALIRVLRTGSRLTLAEVALSATWMNRAPGHTGSFIWTMPVLVRTSDHQRMRLTGKRRLVAAAIAAMAVAGLCITGPATAASASTPILYADRGDVAHQCTIIGGPDSFSEQAVVCVDLDTSLSSTGAPVVKAYAELICELPDGTTRRCLEAVADGVLATGTGVGPENTPSCLGVGCSTGRNIWLIGQKTLSASNCLGLANNVWAVLYGQGAYTYIQLAPYDNPMYVDWSNSNDSGNESTGHYQICP